MKLYTCESGKDLFTKHNEIFGAWDELERRKYEPYTKGVYIFEVNKDDLVNEDGDYNYYVSSSAKINFTKIK